MGLQKYCDHCKRFESENPKIVVTRYTLRNEVVREQKDGNRMGRVQQSAGGIDLCEECWTNIAKPRMNPHKSHGNGLRMMRETA